MDFMQESDVKPAEPAVNGVKLAWRTVGDKEYLAADLSLAKGQKMDFKGFNTLQRLLQPDFYKFNDGNIVFLAPDGDYSIYYLPDLELLYTEYHMDAGYPETLWIGGNGRFTSPWADASSGGKFISPWNTWKHPTGPFYRICCVKTGEDIYEATLYIASGAQNFGQFRFYLRCQTNPWECFSANKAENDNDKPAKDRLSQYYQGAYFQAKSDNFVPKGEANCDRNALVDRRSRFQIRCDNAVGAGGIAFTEPIQRVLRLFDQLRGKRLIFHTGDIGSIHLFCGGSGRFGLLGFGFDIGLCRTTRDCRKQHSQRQNKRQGLPKFSHFYSPFLSFFRFFDAFAAVSAFFCGTHLLQFYLNTDCFLQTGYHFCKKGEIFAFLRFSSFFLLINIKKRPIVLCKSTAFHKTTGASRPFLLPSAS